MLRTSGERERFNSVGSSDKDSIPALKSSGGDFRDSSASRGRDTRERSASDRERPTEPLITSSNPASSSANRLRAEHHRDHERSSSIGSSAVMSAGMLKGAVEKKRRPASQTIPSSHLDMINPTAATSEAITRSPTVSRASFTQTPPQATPSMAVASSSQTAAASTYSTSPTQSSLAPGSSMLSGSSSPATRKKRAPKMCTACSKPIARDGRLAMVRTSSCSLRITARAPR